MLNVSRHRRRYPEAVSHGDRGGVAAQLRGLRQRADEDFASPPGVKLPGRHQIDVAELGLRVAMTRSRYPNRDDGVDQYAVTLSRPNLDRPPGNDEVVLVLASAFGDAATQAVERSTGASKVRMFRVPAQSGSGDSS